MTYIELTCDIFPPRNIEIVMAALSDFGFESFVERDNGFEAYIPEKDFNESFFSMLDIFKNAEIHINYSIKVIPDQNWNALWESNFEAVEIDKLLYIRAPFHPAKEGFLHEIIIEPKMSFGTGHHETTHLMAKLLLEHTINDLSLLDMGCGTAILAILAHKMGAKPILAIDNDEWAYNNSLENIKKNDADAIKVLLGDASLLTNQAFDIILANINRNILLNDIPKYASVLKTKGLLLLSGFYESDLPAIKQKAAQFELHFERYLVRNEWCACLLMKNEK